MVKKKKRNPERMFPNVILPLPCADKGFHEKWFEGRNILNFPHPFRALMCGIPNCGKSTMIKNIVIRTNPQYEKIIIIHGDPEGTLEYDDLDCELLDTIPSTDEHDGEEKTLIILDDIEFSSLSKIDLKNLDRLVGYDSTHKNISVMISSQDAFRLPSIVRRCANVMIVWKIKDKDNVAVLNRRLGLKKNVLFELFQKYLKKPTDSLCFDMTKNTPAPLRLNGFELLDDLE
jgi:predicted AAA+ superfamily ATPase